MGIGDDKSISGEPLTRYSEALRDEVHAALSESAQEIARQVVQSSSYSFPSSFPSRELLDDAVRQALSGPAQEIANQIARSHSLSATSFIGNSHLMDSAVRDALSKPAQEIANRIAQSSSLKYSSLFGSNALLDDAVRQALSGPAQEIANQIARSHSLSATSFIGNSHLMDSAVRDALSKPAQEIAEQISKTSLAWLRNYSGQALEPAIFADVARTLADEELDSPESDYDPIRFDGSASDTSSSPAAIFEKYEIPIKSLQGLIGQLDRLTQRLVPLKVSWRGQADADWGLHSTLYRVTSKSFSGPAAGDSVTLKKIPMEQELVGAERYLISEVGGRWRYGSSPAVELLARMQHRGVPTRLLDATRNPLLALWFAVSDPRPTDARLFAIAHRPIPAGEDQATRTLDKAIWSDHDPFWFKFRTPQERVFGAWGTGTRLREVTPPEYDRRILAQNAVFLLDGAPALTDSVLEQFNTVVAGDWAAADIARSMSVVLAPRDPSRKFIDGSSPLSLVFSFRIPAQLKPKILRTLQRTYGLDWESIYPDIDGIKTYLDGDGNWASRLREK